MMASHIEAGLEVDEAQRRVEQELERRYAAAAAAAAACAVGGERAPGPLKRLFARVPAPLVETVHQLFHRIRGS